MHPIERLVDNHLNGATFVSVDYTSAVRMGGGRKNPFQGTIKHVTGMNVLLFQNKKLNGYSEMVRRRLLNEDKDPNNFQLSPRKWGVRRPNSPFVDHKGRVYLEMIVVSPGTRTYTLDGMEVDPRMIPNLNDQELADQGGLDNKVVIRCMALDTITAMTIDGQRWVA